MVTLERTETCQESGSALDDRQFRLGHRVWLDVLRGIAVTLVVAYHFLLIPNGAYGVDIFFVLSGFLITAILCEEFAGTNTISIKRFYLRRMLRLLPLLYTLVIGYLIVVCLFGSADSRPRAFLEALTVATYSVNLLPLHSFEIGPLGFTWSLCVEEHFYMIWPLVLFAALKFRVPRPAIFLTVVAAIVTVAIWRAHLYNGFLRMPSPTGMDWFRIYSGTDTRADGLMVGCALGLLASWNWLPASKLGMLISKVLGIAASIAIAYFVFFIPCSEPGLMKGLYTAFAILAATNIAWLVVSPPKFIDQKSAFIKTFSALGKISYGMYIIHLPVLVLFGKIYFWWDKGQTYIGWSHPIATALPIAVSCLASWACYHLIERPALNFKKRFEIKSDMNQLQLCNVDAVTPEKETRPSKKAA